MTVKKIDILNFITSFRKAPNDIKTYQELVVHLGEANSSVLNQYLQELKDAKVVREVEKDGEKAFQVIAR